METKIIVDEKEVNKDEFDSLKENNKNSLVSLTLSTFFFVFFQ
jgi:hypothetical protein